MADSIGGGKNNSSAGGGNSLGSSPWGRLKDLGVAPADIFKGVGGGEGSAPPSGGGGSSPGSGSPFTRFGDPTAPGSPLTGGVNPWATGGVNPWATGGGGTSGSDPLTGGGSGSNPLTGGGGDFLGGGSNTTQPPNGFNLRMEIDELVNSRLKNELGEDVPLEQGFGGGGNPFAGGSGDIPSFGGGGNPFAGGDSDSGIPSFGGGGNPFAGGGSGGGMPSFGGGGGMPSFGGGR